MGDKAGIGTWINSMTPEQKKEHYENVKKKRIESARKKRELKQTAQEQARDLLPTLLAQEMMAEKSWQPSEKLISDLRELIKKGYSVEEMRSGPLKGLDTRTWDALTKSLFKDHAGTLEEMGLSLLQSKKQSLKRLKKRAKEIRKEMRKIVKLNKIVSPKYFDTLGKVEDELHKIETDLAKTFYQIEAVGEKAKGGAIHLHINTPRPAEKIPEKNVIELPTK